MSVENLDHQPVHHDPEEKTLEEVLLAILEHHDGLCLDNEKERAILATVLAAAFVVPDSLHQTGGKSATQPPAE